MENSTYNYLHELPKVLNNKRLYCSPYGKQTAFIGRGILKPDEKFRVVQNRKGHRRNNNLTYLLLHKQNNIMIRIDINGRIAIPLSDLPNYDPTDDVVKSLYEFLKYNEFDTKGIQISPSTV